MKFFTNVRLSAIVFVFLTGLLASGTASSTQKSPPFTQSDCADPSLTLELFSQSAVDNFICTSVAGSLTIFSGSAITTLSPLQTLTYVGGLLKLNFNKNKLGPSTLDGLNNVTRVGSLVILDIDKLTDISALGALTGIGPRIAATCTTSRDCFAQLEIKSASITALPPWNITGSTIGSLSLNGGFALTNPAGLDSLPAPLKDLSIKKIPLDTDNVGQLSSLQRLVSQAKGRVTLSGIAGIKTLPTMPVTTILALESLGLTDLSSITPGAFPALEFVILNSLPDIDGSELTPLRNIAKINLTLMTGLTGSNPLLGLAGGTFNTLFLLQLPNITTLADLASVTTLSGLTISELDGLINLVGLENLNVLTELIAINGNSNLQNLDALANLTSVGNLISVERNKALQNLNGLSGIKGQLTTVKIDRNDALTDISGLAGITGVTKDLAVYKNPKIVECDVLVESGLNQLNPAPSLYYVRPTTLVCIYTAPNLVASPSALDFGSGSIGTTIDRSVTLQNVTGSISTTTDVSFVGIAGDSLGEYSILNEDCTANALTGGSTRNFCTVTVRFTVKQTGVDQAQLVLELTSSDNTSLRTFPVNLTAAGTGVAGDQLTPNTNLDFGDVELGTTQTDIITIDNTAGSGPLTVSSLMVTGTDFSLVGNSCGNSYPQTVAVGSQCAVTVSFIPSALGARSGQFTMTSDGATSPDNVNLLGIGVTAPAPVPSPTSLDFGDVVRGTTAVQALTVTNAGAIRNLLLGQLATSGDFSVQSDNCSGTTLAPAASCSVDVVFAPSGTGPATGTLNIPGATGFPSANVALSGAGLEPAALQANPTHLAFGTQLNSTTLDVTITNIGAQGQDAQIGAATVTGSLTPIQFGIASDSCSSTTLAGQATCQISVVFDPSQDDADTGSLDISYNNGQTLSVALSGRGGEPVDYISPSSLSFGDVEISSSSASQQVTVTDNSGIALEIASVSSSDAAFSVSNDTCSSTTVTSSCTFDVTFNPIARGHLVSTIEVISNSASSPDQVAVDGFGMAPPELHLSEPDVDFGAVPVGASMDEIITVTNYGDEDLVIGALSVTGGVDYSIAADACSSATLVGGGSCAFTVTYAPTTVSPTTGSVTLPSNASTSPSALQLTGRGAQNVPTQIPTLSEWARLTLIMLIAMISIGAMRRRLNTG